jgi:high-affinity nickel-transport protein
MRHGLECHNIAAIGDFASAARSPRQAIGLVVRYTLGHVLAISGVGAAVVGLGLALPKSADALVGQVVGLTLIAFGGYVLYLLFAKPGSIARLSRITLIVAAIRWMIARVRKTDRERPALDSEDPAVASGTRPAFALGLVHGAGIETPTQLTLFVLAAGVGGWTGGLLCVGLFMAGLIAMTGLMTAFSAGLLSLSTARRWIHASIMLATGVYSIGLGTALVLGAVS